MKIPVLYRKRLIPSECVHLKDDLVLYRDEQIIVTKWKTLHPKKNLDHGFSCYFLEKNIKVSRFYDKENQLLCWYCDIVTHSFDPSSDTYLFTDLLTDVLVYPDGTVKVLDLDELADAQEQKLLDSELLRLALRTTNWLLQLIYRGSFPELLQIMDFHCGLS